MRIHFFTAPFYFCFHLVQGSRFKVQGLGGGFAAFFRRWYSRIAAFPSRGRGTALAVDRVLSLTAYLRTYALSISFHWFSCR